MKKIIIGIAVLLLLFQSATYANYSIGTDTDSILVSGTAEPYSLVSFMLLDSSSFGTTDAQSTVAAYNEKVDSGTPISTSDIYYFKSLMTNSEGVWSFEVPMPSGEYEKKLTLVPSVGEAEFIEYASIAFRNNMLPVLISAAQTDDDATALKNKISLYIGYIYDKKADYQAINDKLKIAKLNKEMVAAFSPADETALGKLKSGIEDAIFILDIEEGRETNYEVVMSKAEYETAKETQLTDEGKKKIVSNLAALKHNSMTEYKKNAKLQFYINLVNYNKNGSAENLLTVLRESNGVLKLDFTKLSTLSEAGQGKAAKQLVAKKCTDVGTMQTNLDIIAGEIYKEENPIIDEGGSTNVRGGNFGGGKTSSRENSITFTPVPENTPEKKEQYSDIKQAEWASEAINYLSEKGIIEGYEDNTFRPLNSITRAEFVKLIIKTFFSADKPSGTVNFGDVPSDKWYADYVNTAFENGIVSGDNNGRFNPDATISRQDMAVVIYNAGLKLGMFSGVADNGDFSDNTDISDYAKKAVYTLKNAGAVDGVGGGYFSPLGNANRAAAAKIIYSLTQSGAEQ